MPNSANTNSAPRNLLSPVHALLADASQQASTLVVPDATHLHVHPDAIRPDATHSDAHKRHHESLSKEPSPQSKKEAALQRQGFYVGDIGLMVAFTDSSLLADVPTIYRLPKTPSWFLGYANIHGNLIPVVDLEVFLSVAKKTDSNATLERSSTRESSKLLVLGHAERATGVIVSGLPKRMQVSTKDFLASDLVPEKLKPYVTWAVMLNGAFWFDLNLEALLESLEAAI